MKSTHLGFRHLASVLCFGAYALQANANPGHNLIELAVRKT
jgi:hypothetical protein